MSVSVLGILFTTILKVGTWSGENVQVWVLNRFPLVLGILGSIAIFFISLVVVEIIRACQLRRAWRQRLAEGGGWTHPPGLNDLLNSIIRSLNTSLLSTLQKGPAGKALGWWVDSGIGNGPLSFLITLLIFILFGILLGRYFLETTLLRGFILALLLIGFFSFINSRARMQRGLFQDQFPAVLERLADSLLAGFSIPQAIEFVVPSLSQPSSTEMARITDQIRLGFTLDQALEALYKRRPIEDVRILIEGLTLQRQVGGDMASMMRDLADLIRSRRNLENEVKTMTAQGRLSAIVIALLVPVSLGLLSLLPGFTEVLFTTTAGNLVLVAAGTLELLGAVCVARLIRIEV